jgi:hypothetical protein
MGLTNGFPRKPTIMLRNLAYYVTGGVDALDRIFGVDPIITGTTN